MENELGICDEDIESFGVHFGKAFKNNPALHINVNGTTTDDKKTLQLKLKYSSLQNTYVLEGNLHFTMVHNNLDNRIYSALNDISSTTSLTNSGYSTNNITHHLPTTTSSSASLPATGNNRNDPNYNNQPPPTKKVKVMAGTSLFPKRLVHFCVSHISQK